jgi:hypothetical protein
MAQQITIPGVGTINFEELKSRYDRWLASQHPAVEVLVIGAQSASQGAFLGYLLGSVSQMDPSKAAADASAPQMQQQMAALNAGGPLAQARNLAVMTGVNAALAAAIKKARNGKEDVWGA